MAEAVRMKDLRGLKRPEDPWLDDCRRLMFVSDMSDSHSKAVSFEYLENEIVRHADLPLGRRHVWLWLTKRAGRMTEFADWMKARDIG